MDLELSLEDVNLLIDALKKQQEEYNFSSVFGSHPDNVRFQEMPSDIPETVKQVLSFIQKELVSQDQKLQQEFEVKKNRSTILMAKLLLLKDSKERN